MNLLNLFSSGASIFNFGLQNLTNGFGLANPNVEITASKSLHPDQIIKEPPIDITISEKEYLQKEETIQSQNKDIKVDLFTKQQQLINQYMHLNIQLLSKKLENLENIEKQVKPEDQPELQNQSKSSKKKIKKMNNCGHDDREHYAKGMCSNCYHKFGRNKKPWNCPHNKLYANGMCQNCYINSYNKKRRQERAQGKNDEVESQIKIEADS